MGAEAFDDLDIPVPPVPAPKGRAAISREHFEGLAARHLPCGVFHLTLPDQSVRRFRVRLERGSFVTGQRTVAISRKLDDGEFEGNEWETLGVVGPTGFNVFKRWRGRFEERWLLALWAVASGAQSDRPHSYTVERRCWLCMRALDTPEAVATGLTTGCHKKLYPPPRKGRRRGG